MKKDWRRKVYLSVISLNVLVISSCIAQEHPTNILHSKPVKEGWRTRSAIHSKAIDPTTTKEILHVEHCDKYGKQLWMNYHFKRREWRIVEPFNTSCGELP